MRGCEVTLRKGWAHAPIVPVCERRSALARTYNVGGLSKAHHESTNGDWIVPTCLRVAVTKERAGMAVVGSHMSSQWPFQRSGRTAASSSFGWPGLMLSLEKNNRPVQQMGKETLLHDCVPDWWRSTSPPTQTSRSPRTRDVLSECYHCTCP